MYKVTDEKVKGFNVIELTEGKYTGCKLVYGEIKLADEENADGSIDLSFEYEITNDFTVSKDEMPEFKQHIGNTLLKIIEDAIAAEELIFKGGLDENSMKAHFKNNKD